MDMRGWSTAVEALAGGVVRWRRVQAHMAAMLRACKRGELGHGTARMLTTNTEVAWDRREVVGEGDGGDRTATATEGGEEEEADCLLASRGEVVVVDDVMDIEGLVGHVC